MAAPITAVNEQSPLRVTAAFTDADGNPVIPTTVDYRVDDITNDAQVTDWAVLSPASSVAVTIPGSSNLIDSDDNVRELQKVTFRIDDGLNSEAYGDKEYYVMNLGGIT